jgi:hypothetical protein
MLEIERKCLWRIEEHEKLINQRVKKKKIKTQKTKNIFSYLDI